MISKNIIMFGLGTVLGGCGYSKEEKTYGISFYEGRLGRYRVGETPFKDDEDMIFKFTLELNDVECSMLVINKLIFLKSMPQEKRITRFGETIFDFTRGESDKSIDVVIGWFARITEMITTKWGQEEIEEKEEVVVLSKEDLDEELCNYCPLPDSSKGVHCYGGEPVMCVDSGNCDKAYENYLDSMEEENNEE